MTTPHAWLPTRTIKIQPLVGANFSWRENLAASLQAGWMATLSWSGFSLGLTSAIA